MKKSLLALAVLGAYAGVASAQSSVQLFGTLDLNGRYIKNDGRDRQLSMGTDGVNSSEIRFQGIEDLGGGLKAGFNLRSGINPDNGTDNAKFWNRRATVSLYSNAGELRLGRDYVPTFWTTAIFDAFGYNGIGSTGNVQRIAQVRQDNSVGYFLPANLGGFYGQVNFWMGENNRTINNQDDGTGGGFRLGYGAGPFNVALAYARTRYEATPVNGAAGGPSGDFRTWNIGGQWDFGMAKLMGHYTRDQRDSSAFSAEGNGRGWLVGALVPVGAGEIRASYSTYKIDDALANDPRARQIALGYVHNLSKRTAVYTTVAHVRNRDGAAVTLNGSVLGNGTSSTGFDLGIRHSF